MKEKIIAKLSTLNPHILEVVDESEKHIGHSGYKEGGETHFRIEIVSDRFQNLNKIERHKIIYDILKEELKSKIHALSINARAAESQ